MLEEKHRNWNIRKPTKKNQEISIKISCLTCLSLSLNFPLIIIFTVIIFAESININYHDVQFHNNRRTCLLVPLMTTFLSIALSLCLSTSTLASDILWMSRILSPCLPMILPTHLLGTLMVRLSSLGCWAMVCWIRISANWTSSARPRIQQTRWVSVSSSSRKFILVSVLAWISLKFNCNCLKHVVWANFYTWYCYPAFQWQLLQNLWEFLHQSQLVYWNT